MKLICLTEASFTETAAPPRYLKRTWTNGINAEPVDICYVIMMFDKQCVHLSS